LNRAPVRRDVTLDAVLLTHGHLDHTGRLPLLARLGYRGPVFATPATIDMTGLIVRDATRIQAQDVERVNRRLLRLGGEPLDPLYVGEDTEQIVSQLKPVPYRDRVQVAEGVAARWLEAGHMLGSASI
jgi:metallo-beta-lactamase family protein